MYIKDSFDEYNKIVYDDTFAEQFFNFTQDEFRNLFQDAYYTEDEIKEFMQMINMLRPLWENYIKIFQLTEISLTQLISIVKEDYEEEVINILNKHQHSMIKEIISGLDYIESDKKITFSLKRNFQTIEYYKPYDLQFEAISYLVAIKLLEKQGSPLKVLRMLHFFLKTVDTNCITTSQIIILEKVIHKLSLYEYINQIPNAIQYRQLNDKFSRELLELEIIDYLIYLTENLIKSLSLNKKEYHLIENIDSARYLMPFRNVINKAKDKVLAKFDELNKRKAKITKPNYKSKLDDYIYLFDSDFELCYIKNMNTNKYHDAIDNDNNISYNNNQAFTRFIRNELQNFDYDFILKFPMINFKSTPIEDLEKSNYNHIEYLKNPNDYRIGVLDQYFENCFTLHLILHCSTKVRFEPFFSNLPIDIKYKEAYKMLYNKKSYSHFILFAYLYNDNYIDETRAIKLCKRIIPDSISQGKYNNTSLANNFKAISKALKDIPLLDFDSIVHSKKAQ